MTATKEGLCWTWCGNTHHTSRSCRSHLSPWTRACHTSSTSTERGHGGKTSSRGGEEGCWNRGCGILLYTSTRRHGSITLKQWQWNDQESNTWMQNSELSRSSEQHFRTSKWNTLSSVFSVTTATWRLHMRNHKVRRYYIYIYKKTWSPLITMIRNLSQFTTIFCTISGVHILLFSRHQNTT